MPAFGRHPNLNMSHKNRDHHPESRSCLKAITPQLPIEIRDLIFAAVEADPMKPASRWALLACSSTCRSWREALLARVFTSVTIVAEELEFRLKDRISLLGLHHIGPLAREVHIMSRCYPQALNLSWIPTGIAAPIVHTRNFLQELNAEEPLLPNVTTLLINGVSCERFEHLYAFIDFVGTRLQRVRMKNVKCLGFNYHFFEKRAQLLPFVSLEELDVQNTHYQLRMEPLVAWLRAMPAKDHFRRCTITCHDTSDSFASLAFFIGVSRDHLPELAIHFMVEGDEPDYSELFLILDLDGSLSCPVSAQLADVMCDSAV
jgi:hypothetical protein